jgi:hypothetical protein
MSFRKVIQDQVIEDTVLGNEDQNTLVTDVVFPTEEPPKPVLPSIFAKGTEPHKDWVCSVTYKLMIDPVVTEDGYSYERTAIETWFENHSTSPITGAEIKNKSLYTNIGLKGIIQEWKKNNPELVKKDEQLDRQIDMDALRVKPVALPIIRQPSFTSYIDAISFPGWNTVQDMIRRNNSQNITPFTPSHSTPTSTPRINQLMRHNNSSRVIIID